MGEVRVITQGMVCVTADEWLWEDCPVAREIACRLPKTSKWVGCGWRLCGINGVVDHRCSPYQNVLMPRADRVTVMKAASTPRAMHSGRLRGCLPSHPLRGGCYGFLRQLGQRLSRRHEDETRAWILISDSVPAAVVGRRGQVYCLSYRRGVTVAFDVSML